MHIRKCQFYESETKNLQREKSTLKRNLKVYERRIFDTDLLTNGINSWTTSDSQLVRRGRWCCQLLLWGTWRVIWFLKSTDREYKWGTLERWLRNENEEFQYGLNQISRACKSRNCQLSHKVKDYKSRSWIMKYSEYIGLGTIESLKKFIFISLVFSFP